MTEHIVDARGLEPPLPFERAMDALVDLPPGGCFTLLIDRMPHPLLRMLDRDGYQHNTQADADGALKIEIRRPPA